MSRANSPDVEQLLSTAILPGYRTPGMASGDYIDVVKAEVDSLLKRTNGNRLKAVNLGFKRMRDSGLITDNDLKRLEKVSLVVISAEQGKYTQQEAVAKLDRLYLEAAADPESSSMGTTMIGVTYSARSSQSGRLGGLIGMVIGGLISGGPGGALIGGLVGWAAGGGCKSD